MTEAGSTSATDKVAFGRYKLLHLLAQGGMGEVYLARLSGAAGFEKLCVLKTILPNFSEAEDFVQRFHHEARTLVQLNHANIAQIYDMGEADKTYYMALEYVAGVDLARVQKRAKEKGELVPIPAALFIGQRIADALGYAHRKTDSEGKPMVIVHRDMSPHNVLVSYEGEVKVIDFGLAKSAARSLHTMPATVLGKLGYMSPEQARAEDIDQRSDIFSCGVVIWELLTGRPLVKRGSFAEMLAAMAHPRIPSLADVRPDASPELSQAVMRALAVKPEDRFPRADELAAALNEEFVKHKPPITAEKVGNFIRQLCPEEFDEQRKMLSGLSLLAQAGGANRPTSVRPTRQDGPGAPHERSQLNDEATALRQSTHPTRDERGGEIAPTVMRPSELRALRRATTMKFVAIGAIGVGVLAAVIAGIVVLRHPSIIDAVPPVASEPPAVAVVPKLPEPASPPRPVVAPPTPAPAPAGPSAAERRKTLEKRMAVLKRQYDVLTAKVGADQLEPLAKVAYDEARAQFTRGIADPRSYRDIEDALKDAEKYLNAERRRLGQ
jgi:eukaryotic-like serine/threonine-protein kinase